MNRKTAALVAIGTIGIVGVAGAGAASALTSSSSSSSDSLVSKLVAKFNLNKADVQAVFDEERAAQEEARKADRSERLQSAVDSGDITAAQKTAIEQKVSELDTARDSQQAELEKWATDNKINIKYLMGRDHGDSSRLDDAVKAGDITAEQKTLIENKQTELKKARDDQRDALEQWATDNNIDEHYLMGGMMGGRGHGFGGM